jgi:histidinol phosphatase-like enzyme
VAIDHTMDEVRALVSEIERLAPFPDVIKALQELKVAGLKLVILSNGDPDMLETGVEFSGTEDLWTRMVSVAEAGAFKPHFNTYATGAKAVNLAPSEVLFVANHAFDCVGAKAVGMHTGPTACSSSIGVGPPRLVAALATLGHLDQQHVAQGSARSFGQGCGTVRCPADPQDQLCMLGHPHHRVGQLPPCVGDLCRLAQHGGGQAVLCRDEQRGTGGLASLQPVGRAIPRGGEHHEGRIVLACRAGLWHLAELALGEMPQPRALGSPVATRA